MDIQNRTQREIKFRAWNKKLKHFIDVGDLKHYAVTLEGEVINFDSSGYDIIEHFELVRYTGLKDKNGVEIYDGDIVDDHYFERYVSRHKVYWSDNYGRWSTMGLTSPVPDRKQLAYFYNAKNLHRNEDLEVIGNIYENPELLK